jgi:predicted Zn finger-like uncharacterized protein
MLIQCPKCQTTYKVSDEVMKGTSPAFRCSRCKHTFELEAADTAQETPSEHSASTRPSSNEAELSLPFAPEPEAEKIASEPAQIEEPVEPSEPDTEAFESQEEPWAMSEAKREDEQPFVMPAGETGAKDSASEDFSIDDPVFRRVDAESENPQNVLAISPYLEQRASILPYVSLLVLLVVGFGLFTIVSQASPQTPEGILKSIPVLGPLVLKNNHLKDGILIKSLNTGYQSIQGNREVFLISGVALNQNPVVVRELQLTGKVYNRDGKEIEHQTIWVGNTLSPKILRGMTVEDIPQLQELKPLKSFEIPPGDSIPFTIVFLRSAKSASEFSCEVVNAQGAA